MTKLPSEIAAWHIARDGRAEGPFDDDELRSLADNGSLAPDDLIWAAGMPEWSAASSIEGLFQPPPVQNQQMPQQPSAPSSRRKPRAKSNQSVDPGTPPLTTNQILDLEAGVDPGLVSTQSDSHAFNVGHEYRFRNWPVVGSCVAGIFLGWIFMLPTIYLGLPLFIFLGFIVMPIFCLSYVVSEGKGGSMDNNEITFPATLRWTESPIPLPFRESVLLIDIWEASSFKDSQGWYVDLSGEFGGKTIRLMSKAMRDQFYAELRRRAPHVRIFRGR